MHQFIVHLFTIKLETLVPQNRVGRQCHEAKETVLINTDNHSLWSRQATMYSPVGISKYVFPAVPILSSTGVVMLLLILPGFIKTRSIPLISYIVAVIYANVIRVVNAIVWRNTTKDLAPIYCRISKFESIRRVLYRLVDDDSTFLSQRNRNATHLVYTSCCAVHLSCCLDYIGQ